MHQLVAVTGGIGSGKSIVCRVIEALGYDVYDCDSRARKIMDCSDTIKCAIASDICAEAILTDGTIDRSRLSEAVFGNPERLKRLNDIVHSAVLDDLKAWASTRDIAFVETAILYQSGLDRIVDEVWEVVAPTELRISRVICRNGLNREAVLQRIAAQDSYIVSVKHPKVYEIINDDDMAILPQIEKLIRM